jgi:Hexokinase
MTSAAPAGTNACYVEAASRVKTLPEGYKPESDLMCINTEWGNFSAPCLPRLEEDLCVLLLLSLLLMMQVLHSRSLTSSQCPCK